MNERIDATSSRAVWMPITEWVFDCADETCAERVEMTPEEYEELRASPMRPAIAPGDAHVMPEVERIVERDERYWVVEKIGEAKEVGKTTACAKGVAAKAAGG